MPMDARQVFSSRTATRPAQYHASRTVRGGPLPQSGSPSVIWLVLRGRRWFGDVSRARKLFGEPDGRDVGGFSCKDAHGPCFVLGLRVLGSSPSPPQAPEVPPSKHLPHMQKSAPDCQKTQIGARPHPRPASEHSCGALAWHSLHPRHDVPLPAFIHDIISWVQLAKVTDVSY